MGLKRIHNPITTTVSTTPARVTLPGLTNNQTGIYTQSPCDNFYFSNTGTVTIWVVVQDASLATPDATAMRRGSPAFAGTTFQGMALSSTDALYLMIDSGASVSVDIVLLGETK